MSTKRTISVLLTICLLLSGFSVFATETTLSATSTSPAIPTTGDLWDGTITEPKSIVTKDDLYYYEISKCSELAYVAQTGGDWLNYNYILANNLILNDTIIEWDENGECINSQKLKMWIQINDFNGKFDGNGFVISGLYGNGGLFGEIKANSSVNNVILINSYINGSAGIIDNSYSRNTISNCVFDGYVTSNSNCVGGIVGYGNYLTDLSNCVNYGSINGGTLTGGVAGTCGNISNCTNYGIIQGADSTGGIVGDSEANNCTNYGNVYGKNYIGGIGGELYEVAKCTNYGDIFGTEYVSGIGSVEDGASLSDGFIQCSNFGNITATGNYAAGITPLSWVLISECANFSTINGNDYCGGIVAKTTKGRVSNSYNNGNVIGNSYCGGIIGLISDTYIFNCYNSGNVVGTANVGAIAVNKQQLMFGPSSVSETYYLKNDKINSQIFGCENTTEDILNITAKSDEELKAIIFSDNVWNYNNSQINNGYPYLKWQDMLSNVSVNKVSLNKKTENIMVGKSKYLTASTSPANATNKEVVWSSDNQSVAEVSNTGKVTGVSAGTATITATSVDGGYSDSCVVTVTGTAYQEYQINSISIKDNTGKELSEIPNDSFLATVSITNIASGADTMVVIAKYSDKGSFEGLMYVSAEDMPIGSTIKLTLPIDNKNGDIAKLKAFSWASFNSLTPMGNSVSFPAE